MFSCHHRFAATLAAWMHDTLCPLTLCLHTRAICTLLLCFSQPLWSESLKLQCINRTTVVVLHIPDFAADIIDGEQDWTATVVSFDIMIIWSAPQGKFKTFASSSYYCPSHLVRAMWQVQINLVPGIPEAKFDIQPTDVWSTTAPSTDNLLMWGSLRLTTINTKVLQLDHSYSLVQKECITCVVTSVFSLVQPITTIRPLMRCGIKELALSIVWEVASLMQSLFPWGWHCPITFLVWWPTLPTMCLWEQQTSME